jgi:heterotetrameric sarcosine oxidase delta subunit
MLHIRCPYCGLRDQREFAFGGELRHYPKDPMALTDEQWARYLFIRDNVKGQHYEQWCHAHSCRRWFNAIRDTATDRLVATYKIGEEPPQLSGSHGSVGSGS